MKQLLNLALTGLLVAPVWADNLEITEGWVRESIPGQTRSSAYMRIANNSELVCELQGVTSDAAAIVEVHEHQHKDGQMQMRKIDRLVIPPKSELLFKPGGLHLMLFDVRQPLKAGDSVKFEFSAGQCGELSTPFIVKGF